MYKICFLVWIWKRGIFGFWYKAPVIRTAHADEAAARRLGRLFTFDDLFGAGSTTLAHQISMAAGENSISATRVARRRATAATANTPTTAATVIR